MQVIKLHVRVEAAELEGLGWVQLADIGGMSPLATKHPTPTHDYGPHVDVVVGSDDYGETWRPITHRPDEPKDLAGPPEAVDTEPSEGSEP